MKVFKKQNLILGMFII